MRSISALLSLLYVLALAAPSAAERPASAIRYGQDLLGDDDGQLAPRRRRRRRRRRAIRRRRRRRSRSRSRSRNGSRAMHRRRRRRASRAAPVPTTPRSARHAKVAARARELVGVSLKSDAALLSRAVDRAIGTAAINGALAKLGASRAREPGRQLRPGDIVAFRLRGSQRLLAVVVERRGARVRFVYRFAGLGRLGVLHARQPNRRRLPGERIVANTYLRPVRVGESPETPRLAGQLLEGALQL